MLLIVIAALLLYTLVSRRRTVLEEGTAGVIGPAYKTVKATVDGKPVHSYVKMDADENQG